MAEEFGANHSMVTAKDSYIKAKNICIEATSNITIKVGQSSIALTSKGIKVENAVGKIVLESMEFSAKGTQSAKVESSLKTEVKGTMTDVNGSGMVNVKGGLVKIN